MSKTLLILVFLLVGYSLHAQQYIDILKYDYSISPKNTFKDNNVYTTLQEMSGELNIPLKINEKSTFLTGMFFEYSSALFEPEREIESVFGTTLKLGMNMKHSNQWSGTYLLLPKISSDFHYIKQNDLQFGGVALMQFNKTSSMNYKFGVYANGDLFGPFIVPILGFYSKSQNEKLEVKLLLPLHADINYAISNSMKLGFYFKGMVRTYNLNSPFETEQHRYLAKSTNDLYSYFQFGFKNGFHLQAGFGRSLARSFRVYDEQVNWGIPLYYNGDNRKQLNNDFTDGWLLKLGLFYRMNINN